MGTNRKLPAFSSFKLFKQIMKFALCGLLLLVAYSARVSGYQCIAIAADSYNWRNCNPFEATKKNCPIGEACLADVSYKGYIPNYALKCLDNREYLVNRDTGDFL